MPEFTSWRGFLTRQFSEGQIRRIAERLTNPETFEQHQEHPFGFRKFDILELKGVGRLAVNLWSEKAQETQLAFMPHTHSSHLESYVIDGEITNRRYAIDGQDEAFAKHEIIRRNPLSRRLSVVGAVGLREVSRETFTRGQMYAVGGQEIHWAENHGQRSAVTLVVRPDAFEANPTMYAHQTASGLEARAVKQTDPDRMEALVALFDQA